MVTAAFMLHCLIAAGKCQDASISLRFPQIARGFPHRPGQTIHDDPHILSLSFFNSDKASLRQS
jgi:hypothetical protein